jgi:hypothetical protein
MSKCEKEKNKLLLRPIGVGLKYLDYTELNFSVVYI